MGRPRDTGLDRCQGGARAAGLDSSDAGHRVARRLLRDLRRRVPERVESRGRVASMPARPFGLFVVAVAGTPPSRLSIEFHLNKFGSFRRKGCHAPRGRMREREGGRGRNPEPVGPQAPSPSSAATNPCSSAAGQRVALPIVASYEIWSPWTSRREREFLMGPGARLPAHTASPASGELALTLSAPYTRGRAPRGFGRPLPRTRRVFEASVDADHRIEIPPDWRPGPAVAEVRYTGRSRTP
jgi:hypothetical protein